MTYSELGVTFCQIEKRSKVSELLLFFHFSFSFSLFAYLNFFCIEEEDKEKRKKEGIKKEMKRGGEGRTERKKITVFIV